MSRSPRLFTGILLLCLAALPQARALLIFDEGKDQVFVSATYGVGYNSNVYSTPVKTGSFTQNASFSIDYSRRAGVISVNASIGVNIGNFSKVQGENFRNPAMTLSFNKGKGRTTGSLSFGAQRENRPDPNANQRTQAWNYSSNLDLRYPVNDRYFFTSNTDYAGKFYTNKVLFADLNTYAQGVNVNYVYTSKLDFNGGYRFRASQTDKQSKSYDNAFTVGAGGTLLPKLNGSLNIGYQRRTSEVALDPKQTFNALTSSMSLNWPFTRTLGFTADLSKDFNTTSTNSSTDSTSASVHANSTLTRKFFLSCGISEVHTIFRGIEGGGRIDNLTVFDANIGFAFTTKIRSNLSYAHTINQSNRSGSTFSGDTFGYTVSARY